MRALVTGITGQDGSYLAELLLEKGYEVFGLARRSSRPSYERIAHILDHVRVIDGDLTDPASLHRALEISIPTEVYNLGAQSFVATSWNTALATADANALGCTRLLEALRGTDVRYYQASSSEMFGSSPPPQSEDTLFHPRSPYGVSKVYAFHITVNYRESFGMHATNGILFNHESPRRGLEFVTRTISTGVAKIVAGQADELRLGNLNAVRDWGYAGDFVEAMWLMLQRDQPDDYVVATGRTATVRDFAEMAFRCVDLSWEDYVVVDEALLRPAEVDVLCGDASKARRCLGWEPKVTLEELVEMMVRADVDRVMRDAI